MGLKRALKGKEKGNGICEWESGAAGLESSLLFR